MNDNRHLIEVKEPPGKGKGIFARDNIPAGTLLLHETPLLDTFSNLPNTSLGTFIFSDFTPPEEIRKRQDAARETAREAAREASHEAYVNPPNATITEVVEAFRKLPPFSKMPTSNYMDTFLPERTHHSVPHSPRI